MTEWADRTFNPWSGCTKISPGCANCYAERLSARGMTNGKGERTLGEWGPGAPRKRTSPANWRKPLRWDRQATGSKAVCASCGLDRGFHGPVLAEAGDPQCDADVRTPFVARRPRVFCASLADWLDPEVPAEWLADLLALIDRTPHLDWLLLTKRPELFFSRLWEVSAKTEPDLGPASAWLADEDGPDNVWVGTSVEDQQRADERIPHLLRIPARVRFLSCEPLLGPVDLSKPRIMDGGLPVPGLPIYYEAGPVRVKPTGRTPHEARQQEFTRPGRGWVRISQPPRIHWVIAGGESGPGARPMHPEWARSLRDQCQAAGVAFHFKQWGEWAPGGSLPGKPNGRVIGVHAAGMTAWTPDNDHNPFALGHPGWRVMSRVGKKAAGRLLDGRTWDEVPS